MSSKVNTYKIARNIKFVALKLIEDCDDFDYSVNDLKDEASIVECQESVAKDIREITRFISMIFDEMEGRVSTYYDNEDRKQMK